MSYPSLTFAHLLENATRAELEQFVSLLQGYLSVEHDENGRHTAITADSIDVDGNVTAGGTGTFDGDVTADADGVPAILGQVSSLTGVGNISVLGRIGALLIGGTTNGYFLEVRTFGSPFTSGNELRIWNLADNTNAAALRFGLVGGVPTILDGGTGASGLAIGGSSDSPTGSFASLIAEGRFTAQAQMLETGVISASITSNTNNWNPTGLSTARHIRVDTDASRNLTGIVAQTAGTWLTLWNFGGADLVLKHADANSSAANRFQCPGQVDFTVNGRDAISLWYDGTSSVWRPLGV